MKLKGKAMNLFVNKELSNSISNSELLNNRKYIVLKYLQGLREWYLMPETEQGISKYDAEVISNYEVKYRKTDPNKILIVEVPEI